MKKQLRIPFESINWDLFCKRGALLPYFNGKDLVFGFGEHLSEGEISFFQQDFFNLSRLVYTPEFVCLVSPEQWSKLEASAQPVHVVGDEDETYLKDLRLAINSFDDTFKKVVLISRELYSKKGVCFKKLLGSLLRAKLGFNYGLWNEDRGILGSTPEILFSREGKRFQSMALAATRPLERKEELLSDEKELFEHNLVVEDIKDKLVGQQNVHVGQTGIEVFGNLAHLRTDISFESGLGNSEVSTLLSPTAALGGYPKALAREFIKNSNYHKSHPMRNFGGVVGIERGEQALALVAIRNVQWDASNYWIECGGGVVQASTVENEMAEIHRKRKVIKDVFFSENV